MATEYVEQRNGGYYVAGPRVSLDSVAYGFLRGESADEIASSFPAITLEQSYGAIAYYLANRDAIDRYLAEEAIEFDKMREESRQKNPRLYAKLDAARNAAAGPR